MASFEYRSEIHAQDATFHPWLSELAQEGWLLVTCVMVGMSPVSGIQKPGQQPAVPVLDCVFRREKPLSLFTRLEQGGAP